MRVVAGGAVEHHSLTGPIVDSFSMSSTQPVAFLTKMALTTKLVTVVKIDPSPLLVCQEVSFFRVMAIHTA